MPYKQCTDVVTDIQLQSLSGLTLKHIFNFDLFTDPRYSGFALQSLASVQQQLDYEATNVTRNGIFWV